MFVGRGTYSVDTSNEFQKDLQDRKATQIETIHAKWMIMSRSGL